MKNNTFSIIIPVFNAEKYIIDCLESVRKQSYQYYEIIIINDGSTDLTEKKIKEYVIKYPMLSLKYLYQENAGAGIARAKGIEVSVMKYIAFLDADDIWYENKLYEVNIILNNYDVNFIYHDEYEITLNNNKKKLLYRNLKDDALEDLIMNGNPISTSTVVVERNLLLSSNTFKFGKRHGEDIECWVEIAKNKAKFYHIPKILGEYRRVSTSLTLRDINFTKDTNKLLLDLYDNLTYKYSKEEIEKLKEKRILQNLYNEARFYHKIGKFQEAKKLYKKAINLGTNNYKVYLGILLVYLNIKF